MAAGTRVLPRAALALLLASAEAVLAADVDMDLSTIACKDRDLRQHTNNVATHNGVNQEDCHDLCKTTAGCAVASYKVSTSSCKLKVAVDASPTADSDFDTIYLTCEDSAVTVDRLNCRHVGVDNDAIGYDVYPGHTVDSCRAACAAEAVSHGCVLASFDTANGNCFVKSTRAAVHSLVPSFTVVYPSCVDLPEDKVTARAVSAASAADFAANMVTLEVPRDAGATAASLPTFCALTCRSMADGATASCNAFVADGGNNKCLLGVVAEAAWLDAALDPAGTDFIYVGALP